MRKIVRLLLILLLSFTPATIVLAIKPKPQMDDYEKNLVRFPGSSSVVVKAKQALVMDFETGEVLLSKNHNDRLTPSSMTKMMTSYIIEEKLLKKELNLNSSFYVDEEAWRTQGSKTFVPLGAQISVDDLHRGIVIQSGNDACVVAAKGIAGGERQFAALMNAKAKELGLNNSNFKNSHGLPEENHYSTARDLALLGSAIIKHHPEFYNRYRETEFTFNNIRQGNRNPLLYQAPGSNGSTCDGVKTGHTEDGGYGAVLSCQDNGRRNIIVINGLSSNSERKEEAFRLKNWYEENFHSRPLIKEGEIVETQHKVKFALKPIRVAARGSLHHLMLRTDQSQPTKKLLLNDKIQAPIKQGDVLGKIVFYVNGKNLETELVALDATEKMGLVKQALSYFGL